jgi:uncharacterized glyoxalase superfamily protein PhnB
MTRRPRKEGTQVTSRSAAAQHLRDPAWLRRVRDRIDREYAQPLDVQALARGVNLSAGHRSRQFRRAYGESPYGYLLTRRIERATVGMPSWAAKQVTRPVRNQEAPVCRAAARATAMDSTLHPSFLPHNDPEASLAFYRDTLGFQVPMTSATAGCAGSRSAPPTSPARPSSCTRRPPACGITDDERRTIAEMMAKGTYAGINLATADLDGTFARLQASDAEVVQEPNEQPYGVCDCVFRDPAGNLIRINELTGGQLASLTTKRDRRFDDGNVR